MELFFIPSATFDGFFHHLLPTAAEIPSNALHSLCISICQYPTTAEMN
jgi:hypothetical protein